MGNITLAIIKPDAMAARYQGKMIDHIVQAGFKLVAARIVHLTKAQAEALYAIHKGRPFFDELTTFMSSATCLPLVLEKENAVIAFRELIGATDPAEADSGTLRKEFATSVGENAIHGSDSNENAEKEVAFFFTAGDILSNL